MFYYSATAAPSTTVTSPSTTSSTTPAEVAESADDGEEALKASAIGTLKVCPGVCVATRISDYCEAVLNVDGLCKTAMKCCVTKSLFGDSDPPPELVCISKIFLTNSS